MEKTVRINKALADAGVCSRRRADELVAAGLVRVNGDVVVSAGLQVRPGIDTLEVQGKEVTPPHAESCYLLLHKPIQVVSTAYDPDGRTTVLDLVPEQWQDRRLYPAGRLDFFSEGLVLLTDDGELTHRLVHPSHHLSRVYHVLVRGAVSAQALEAMRAGMTLEEGETLAPVEVRVLPGSIHDLSGQQEAGQSRTPTQSDERMDSRTKTTDSATDGSSSTVPQTPPSGQSGTLLELTLHQGLNRQIRRMCRDLNLTILRLIRVAQGPLQLGVLGAGEVRSLSPVEVKALRKAVGLL